jgi:hypothetical protein
MRRTATHNDSVSGMQILGTMLIEQLGGTKPTQFSALGSCSA